MQNINPLSNSSQPENVACQMARQEPAPVLAPFPHRNASAADISQSSTQSPLRGLTRAQKRRMQRPTAKGQLLVQATLESCPESSERETVSPCVEVVASPALSSHKTLPTLEIGSARNYGPLFMKAGVTMHRVSFLRQSSSPQVYLKAASRETSIYQLGTLSRD